MVNATAADVTVTYEFQSHDRNPNANGSDRIAAVTTTGDVTRVVISGLQGNGLNTRLITLSDVTMPTEAYKSVIEHALLSQSRRK